MYLSIYIQYLHTFKYIHYPIVHREVDLGKYRKEDGMGMHQKQLKGTTFCSACRYTVIVVALPN